ncbi:hypothetical protein P879_08070 [Paragonimus westermani]|uniref:XK-related protein n=1 Tax=Paragonimus westermani TaxID=34504 RepID=A0A8T0D4J3_9TREM|nr:hypothetical protein P879_08070 [Paragonimus westermani]
MLCDTTHSTRNSEATASIATTPGYPAKFLVTRRPWQADTTWAKFPVQLKENRAYTTIDRESTTAWIGDYVDSGVPGQPSAMEFGVLRDSVPPPQRQLIAVSESQEEWDNDPTNRTALAKFLLVHGFRPYQLIFFLLSVLTYASDIGSDAYLVYSYYKQGDYFWSGLTLILLVVPALVMTTFSLAWYVLDRKLNVDPPRTCRAWTLRLFFHGLQLAPLVRLTDAVYYGLASRRANVSLVMAVRYTQLMLYEDADSAMLRMIECFMEAAPQLLLQLYIILTQDTPTHTFQIVAQAVSCFTSWLSLAWSLTHYQSALRSSRVEKANLTWLGSMLYFGWKAGLLASRILALALFAAIARGFWFTVLSCAHWMLSVSWLVIRGTTFCSPVPRTLPECLFDIVLGAVYCFDVVNVREGHSRLWYLTYYSLVGLENFVMTLIWSIYTAKSRVSESSERPMWLIRTPSLSAWIRDVPDWVLPTAVVVSFVFGLGMMLAYYMFAHPSRNIKLWIPCDMLFSDDETTVVHSDATRNLDVKNAVETSSTHDICSA